jgi:site-specific recombinase XerD
VKIKDEVFYKTVRDFLETYLIKQKNYSRNTQRAYRIAFSQLLDYFKAEKGLPYSQIGFDTLSYDHVCGYLQWLETERGCSPQTVNGRLMALRSFAKYAGIIDPSKIYFQVELSNVPRKKVPVRTVEHLSESVLECLFMQPDVSKSNGHRDQFFMILMYDTAARCQELLDLKIGDVNLKYGAPYISLMGKGSKIRRVPISSKIAEHFASYLDKFHPSETRKNEELVFYTTSHGERHRMSPDAVSAFLKKYGNKCREACAETPPNIHAHLLRHSRAMFLYRNGMPLVLLSEFLGHADVNTTRIYAWADTEMKREAISKIESDNDLNIQPIWNNDESIIKQLYGIA